MNIYDFWQKYISKSYPLFKKILRNNLDLENIKVNDKILDFGCGTGKYCFLFNPKNYFGVDVNNQSLKIAHSNFPGYQFIQFRDHQLNFKDKYFHLILILGVFHHISNRDLVIIMKELKRVLKDDGKIIILEPILSNTSTRLNKWMQFIDRGKHFRLEEDLLNLLGSEFKIKEKEQFITELFYNEKVYELTLKDTPRN